MSIHRTLTSHLLKKSLITHILSQGLEGGLLGIESKYITNHLVQEIYFEKQSTEGRPCLIVSLSDVALQAMRRAKHPWSLSFKRGTHMRLLVWRQLHFSLVLGIVGCKQLVQPSHLVFRVGTSSLICSETRFLVYREIE